MLVSVGPVVELIHSVVSLSVDESPPKRHKEGGHDEHDTSSPYSNHGPPAHGPVHQTGQQYRTGRVPTEVGVVDNVLQGVQKNDGIVLGFDFVAETRMLFHVVVELVLFALLQQPRLIIAGLMPRNISLVQEVNPTHEEQGAVQTEHTPNDELRGKNGRGMRNRSIHCKSQNWGNIVPMGVMPAMTHLSWSATCARGVPLVVHNAAPYPPLLCAAAAVVVSFWSSSPCKCHQIAEFRAP